MQMECLKLGANRCRRPLLAGGGAVLLVGLVLLSGGGSRSRHLAQANDAAQKEAGREVFLVRAGAVPAALGMASHAAYNRTPAYRYDRYHVRQGPMLFVGMEGGRVLALAPQCTMNFRFPNYSLVKGAAPGEPTFTAGVLSLTLPGASQPSRFLVSGETDWNYLQDPSGGFDAFVDAVFPEPPHVRQDFPAAWVDQAIHFDKLRQWHALRREKPMVQVEPIGNHDLAFVSFPAIPGLRTLGLEKPREKVLSMLKEMPFSTMLGREFLLRCEECVALSESREFPQSSAPVNLLRLAQIACFLLAPEFLPALNTLAAIAEMLPVVLDAVGEFNRGVKGVEDLNKLAGAGILGTMLDLTKSLS